MNTTWDDFAWLIDQATEETGEAALRPAIEKEMLICHLLFCLNQSGLLDELVFRGDTALRLCHSSNCYSEDLDFAGGQDFSPDSLASLKSCIEDFFGSRYGLKTRVKEPATLQQDPTPGRLSLSRWWVGIDTTPQRRDIPRVHIKIEVANIPAHTKEAVPLQMNSRFLPNGYDGALILTETLDEIMTDKLMALPVTQTYVRYRDVWDLGWLQRHGATVQPDLVQRKMEDYGLSGIADALDDMMERLPGIIAGMEFRNVMRCCLPLDVYDRTLGRKKFERFLTRTVVEQFKELKQKLYGEPVKEEFRM